MSRPSPVSCIIAGGAKLLLRVIATGDWSPINAFLFSRNMGSFQVPGRELSKLGLGQRQFTSLEPLQFSKKLKSQTLPPGYCEHATKQRRPVAISFCLDLIR